MARSIAGTRRVGHDETHFGFLTISFGQTDEIQRFEPACRYDRTISGFHLTFCERGCVAAAVVVIGAHHLVNLAGHVLIDGHVGVGGVASLNVIFEELTENRTCNGAVFLRFCQFHHRGTFSLADNLHVDAIFVEADELNLYCLWPYEASDGGNEDSVVLRLVYEDISVLFTGDIGFESEGRLVDAGAMIDSDILKVGHHGSAYSTSSEFIEHVSPDTAIISVGAYNRYGHPSPETVERLDTYGCEIRRTDLEGAIIYEFG